MFKSLLQNVQISAENIGNLSETKKDLADFFYIFKENLSITALFWLTAKRQKLWNRAKKVVPLQRVQENPEPDEKSECLTQ